MVRQVIPIQQAVLPKTIQTVSSSPPLREKRKLLYIDDESHLLFLFTELFRNTYQVFTTRSGEEGIEILRQNPDIPVIVTDQKMPKMTGVEFFEQILPDFPYPTRIILTGYTDVEDIIAAINTGRVYQYITKPWDESQLRVIIEKAVEYYDLTMKNHRLLAEKTSLLENMGDGLIAIDTSMLITALNKKAMSLLDIERDLPLPAHVSQALADFPAMITLIERTLSSRQPQPHQEIRLKGRQYLLVSTSLIHLPDQPSPTGLIVLLSDVTELRQLQQRLTQQEHQQQRQALLNELSARFRHRIGNDLGGIQLSAKRLQQNLTPEQRQQSLELILNAASEMDAEVRRFRDGIRTLNALQQLTLSMGDVNTVIENALAHSQAQIEAANVKAQKQLASNLPQIPLDAIWLRDAIQNLISNAVDAMVEGGQLTLRSQLIDGQIEVQVSDTGCGIPDEYISRIFTPYFTLKPKGTGLGLPMARDVVWGHGGEISVSSEVGKGTTFRLRFPCA
jgi:signal transduction histidine kinase